MQDCGVTYIVKLKGDLRIDLEVYVVYDEPSPGGSAAESSSLHAQPPGWLATQCSRLQVAPRPPKRLPKRMRREIPQPTVLLPALKRCSGHAQSKVQQSGWPY